MTDQVAAIHPKKGKLEVAMRNNGFYGPGKHSIRFSDGTDYPEEQVEVFEGATKASGVGRVVDESKVGGQALKYFTTG